MKKIVLINPPNDMNKKNNFSNGLFSLGTILKREGYSVRIIDFGYLIKASLIKETSDSNINIDIMCNYILNENPDVVSFYTMSNSYYLTIKLSKILKEKKSKIKIIFGGPQATLTSDDTLKICPWIDAIGLGEGEKSISNIIYNLVNNIEFTNEHGVAYIKNNIIIKNQVPLIKDLDNLPKYDYSLLEGTLDEKMQLDVGRGCPFGCKYCSTKTFWKRNFRLKSSDRIIDEIIYVKEKFNITDFIFEHDLFTVNKNKVLEFCNKLTKKNINITWGCSSRADTLDEELIRTMKNAGCKGIYLGIETGSEKIQKIVNKNLNLKKIITSIILLKKYNIEVTTSFMYGFPEESEDDINLTLDLIYKLRLLNVDTIQLHLFTVFPGTEYYTQLNDYLYLSNNNLSDAACNDYINLNDKNFIESNKNIFSQYLDFKIGLREDLNFLDIYIAIYSKSFMKYMNRTYSILLDIYGSHLNIFKNFRRIHQLELNNNKNSIHKLTLNPERDIKLINEFICNTEYIHIKHLKEIFKFESDIILFIYYSKNNKLQKTYNYDVYEIKKHGLTEHSLSSETTLIEFTRCNDKNDINIKKFSYNTV